MKRFGLFLLRQGKEGGDLGQAGIHSDRHIIFSRCASLTSKPNCW